MAGTWLLAVFYFIFSAYCTKANTNGDDICYEGYTNSNGYCFKFFPGQRTIAYFARRTCEHNNGHLAFIDSEEKNDALFDFLKNYATSGRVYIDGRRQYSFKDINYEGMEMGFHKWDSDFTEILEKCVVLNMNTGNWFLDSCFEYNDFVCEMYM